MSIIPPLVLPAVKRHTATVILVHGLGDCGATWTSLPEFWGDPSKFDEVSFIFPNAPLIASNMSNGEPMRGWYNATAHSDIKQRSADEPGIKQSMGYLHGLIQQEMDKGIPSDRIVIGGFSQGGAMSLLSGITSPNKLGGIVGLSSYILLQEMIPDMVPRKAPNKDTPIFMAHGDADLVVAYSWGQFTANKLKELGYKVDFKTYEGLEHDIGSPELEDLEAYLAERLPPLGNEASDTL